MPTKKYKIFLLESDKILLDMYQAKLEQSGFQVIGFERLPENLTEVVTNEQPNLIFLDMMTRDQDKADSDIIDLLKDNPLTKKIPIISLTELIQKVTNECKQRGMSSGEIEYYILNAHAPSNVVMKIKKILGIPINDRENKNSDQKHKGPENNKGVKKYKILHFEDDTFLRSMYEKKFPMNGFEYIGYDSPTNDPVNVVLKEKPDLIIMDTLMPTMDGFKATQRLKADSCTKNIPIFGLSNLGQRDDIQKALDVGMSEYFVSAHFSPIEIIERVRKTLELSTPIVTLNASWDKKLYNKMKEKSQNTEEKSKIKIFNFWKACGGYFLITFLILLAIVLINEHNIYGDEFWGITILSMFIAPILAYFTKWAFETKLKLKKIIKEKNGLKDESINNFEDMNRKKRYELIIIASLIVIGFIFYWYELRPSFIRKSCAHEASARWNFESNGWNDIYFGCLHGKGLEK